MNIITQTQEKDNQRRNDLDGLQAAKQMEAACKDHLKAVTLKDGKTTIYTLRPPEDRKKEYENIPVYGL